MALIRRRLSCKKVDFLGNFDECYTLQGHTHKHLAQKFFTEITDQQKQLLLFFGEKGMGKTRLAKQTARELAKLVNKDTSEPALFLFFVNCERFGREKGADISNIKLEIAQKVAAVDENLSKVLSSSTIDEFSTKLSMGLRQRVFLFLMDGIDPSCKGVISFLDNLVQHNENILVLTTSCAHFNLPRLGPNVSSYVCTGLEEDAAVALLREVAGNVKDLTEYQQELVSHCYFNPLLIMTSDSR
ncbi:hypothetical protein BSL78_00993 [Apostichopus japonicus]|uniref:NACHT domain-containing protein n=1 Tax=Stichopus japonicus TaxID=307972 RepID=A0A2G8LP44_STIJA|nr:hypothetical protein BSL78_00993 [Apostichopus japonicus]